MIDFELVVIKKKDFSSCHDRGKNKKKILSTHEESNLRPSEHQNAKGKGLTLNEYGLQFFAGANCAQHVLGG